MKGTMRLGMKSNFRKDIPVGGLNSCHANTQAIKTAGYTLMRAVEIMLIFSLVTCLEKEENAQQQILKETEEAHKPIYGVSLDRFSFESY